MQKTLEELNVVVSCPKGLKYIRPGPVTTKDYVELIYHMEKILGPDYKLDLLPRCEGGISFYKDPTVGRGVVKFIRMNVGSPFLIFTPDKPYDNIKDMFEGCTFPQISKKPLETLDVWKKEIAEEISSRDSTIKSGNKMVGIGKVIFYDRENPSGISYLTATFEVAANRNLLYDKNASLNSLNNWLVGEIEAFKSALKFIQFNEDNEEGRKIVDSSVDLIKMYKKRHEKKEEILKHMKEEDLKQTQAHRSNRPINKCANPSCTTQQPANEIVVLRQCSRCKSVRYCGTKCQTDHWVLHKEKCKPSSNS